MNIVTAANVNNELSQLNEKATHLSVLVDGVYKNTAEHDAVIARLQRDVLSLQHTVRVHTTLIIALMAVLIGQLLNVLL